ncbi:MAG: FhaA domain-containing protein [Propionibacteriaceae bacterium]
MGFFDKVERKIDGAVNGVFARAFRGDVQPVEITSRIEKELDREARLLSRDKRLVPNEFVIGLSAHDYERLFPYTKSLNSEIIPELREYATQRSYVFNGPIGIKYIREDLPTGKFSVTCQAVAAVKDTAPANPRIQQKHNDLVLEVNGIRHPLVAPGLVIGRGAEAELRINDPGISRRHAEIIVIGEGPNQVIEVVDLGSTNGISVNGQKVERATLTDGSRIEVGSTRMLVHRPTA